MVKIRGMSISGNLLMSVNRFGHCQRAGHAPPLARRRGPAGWILFSAVLLLARSSRASGCFSATCSNIRAGPSGLRRPCSQLRSVAVLIPMRIANLSCERPYCSRIFLTSDSAKVKVRAGFIVRFIIAPPCFTLLRSSSKSSFFIGILLLQSFSAVSTGPASNHLAHSWDKQTASVQPSAMQTNNKLP